jgi:hypothetical protein
MALCVYVLYFLMDWYLIICAFLWIALQRIPKIRKWTREGWHIQEPARDWGMALQWTRWWNSTCLFCKTRRSKTGYLFVLRSPCFLCYTSCSHSTLYIAGGSNREPVQGWRRKSASYQRFVRLHCRASHVCGFSSTRK